MTNGTSVARCDLFLRNTTARYCGAHGNCLHIATNYHADGRNKKQFIIIVLGCYGILTSLNNREADIIVRKKNEFLVKQFEML